MKTITATTYNQTPGKALHIADEDGEVTVTVRGKARYVVLSEQRYAAMRAQLEPPRTLLQVMQEINAGLDLDGIDDALFERDRSKRSMPRPIEKIFDDELVGWLRDDA